MKIYIDADACPKQAKELAYKSSGRLKLPIILVANTHQWTPESPYISMVQVEKGPDVADYYIAEKVKANDLVITADIPLAGLIVDKGAIAINPRGEIYTQDSISERLSMRNFMQELRDSGIQTDGPAPYGDKDKINFANSLNKVLTQLTGK